MKKIVSVVVITLLILLLIGGCGTSTTSEKNTVSPDTNSSEQSNKDKDTMSTSAKKVTLNFYYWDENQKPGMDKIIEEFEKLNPDISIESTIIPWAQYWTKLQTSLPSASGPDIFWLNADHAVEYIPAGLILDIQQYIDKDHIDLSNFPDNLKELYTWNGKLYAIPKDYDTIALFYNKELFDKAGVEYPNDSWTWEDLLNAAKKLTITKNGTITQYGFLAGPSSQSSVFNFILQNGGKIFNDNRTDVLVNSPENKEAIQFLVDMMYKYKVSPTGTEQQEMTQDKMFISGQVAMVTDGSWMAKFYYEGLGDKVDVAPLPKGKTRACVIHGLGFAASAKTKHPDEAWQFLKFVASKEAQEGQAEVVIPAYKGAEKKWLEAYPSMNLKVFIDALEYASPIPVAAKNPSAVRTAFDNEIQNIWLQQKDVATGLADAEKKMKEELER